jgi:alpha/beta superfamily hydrolase
MDVLKPVTFAGPSGRLEGLWKEAQPPRRGGAVFAHPHPLHGGTLHNKVVYRVTKTLAEAGWETLRFNFRGVGTSQGRHDAGRGETDDFRAALDEVEKRAGLPILAGGFSFGAAVALRAIAGDSRVYAYLGMGLPVATESAASTQRPDVPALFVVGERDTFGPPELLRDFVGNSGEIVVIPGADHFFAGQLDRVSEAIRHFLDRLAGASKRA